MPGPLAGVRVVELAGIGPAQLGAMILSDLGATVIRIDRTDHVPASRPVAPSPELLARGRRSVALNLKSPRARNAALALIRDSDVLLDPYRPGVLERLGLDPAQLIAEQASLLVARMTGWGQDGTLAAAAGHDINYIALTGALEPIGPPDRPPTVPLNLVADFGGGGMLLAVGVLAGLLERERSGRGQVIDVAMIDGVATLLTSILQLAASGTWSARRGENWVAGGAPWYRAYETRDGRFLTVGALEPKFYAQLLARLGLRLDDWPQWDRTVWPTLERRLSDAFAGRTLREWDDLLKGTDVCYAPVLSVTEAAAHPHLASRGTYVAIDGVLQPAPAPRFERTPGAIGRPPPWPGQHTREVLEELELAPGTVAQMLSCGEAVELG
jgi:alpha-methylacyl-CoA racemase